MTGGVSTASASQAVNRVVAILPYVSLLGFIGLVPNLVFSFEEPHTGMLLVATLLLSVAPVGLLVHLATTRELTAQERRVWLAGLMSRKAARFFAAYFNARERRRTTQQPAALARSRTWSSGPSRAAGRGPREHRG